MQGNVSNTNAQDHITDCNRLLRDFERIGNELQTQNKHVSAFNQTKTQLEEYLKWAEAQTHVINTALSKTQTSQAGQPTT